MDIYKIRIHSLFDSAWKETFAVETLSHDFEQGQTLLFGMFDQAQLQGILTRIHDVGLKLVAVQMVDGDENARFHHPSAPA